MSDLTVELAAPGAVCVECFEHRRDLSLGAGTLAIVVCYCRHSSTAAFWSPVSGWASRSPLSEEAFEVIVAESVRAASAQLEALRHVQTWVLDRCTRDSDENVVVDALYRDYQAWAKIEQLGAPVDAKNFLIALKRSGLSFEQRSAGLLCLGLRVRKLA